MKAGIYYCNKEAMPKPIDCYNCELMNTFETLVLYWPVFIKNDLAICKDHVQPFLFTPYYRIKKITMLGFLKLILERSSKVTLLNV